MQSLREKAQNHANAKIPKVDQGREKALKNKRKIQNPNIACLNHVLNPEKSG